jgi:hypothetical protein
MTFAHLQRGDLVFLDANTFIYHAAPDPVLGPPCRQLLQRIENQELLGYTSLHLLPEVAHKMMTVEANAAFGWPFAAMANRLRRHPAEVQRLTAHRMTIARIAHSRVQVRTGPAAVSARGAGPSACPSSGPGRISPQADARTLWKKSSTAVALGSPRSSGAGSGEVAGVVACSADSRTSGNEGSVRSIPSPISPQAKASSSTPTQMEVPLAGGAQVSETGRGAWRSELLPTGLPSPVKPLARGIQGGDGFRGRYQCLSLCTLPWPFAGDQDTLTGTRMWGRLVACHCRSG